MILTFDPVRFPIGKRRTWPIRHRVKGRSTTLGATRSRLLWVLRNLGFANDRIETRLREEQESQRLIEERRLRRLQEEDEARRALKAQAYALWIEYEQHARFLEEQKAAWLIREKRRYELMTEEQKAISRHDEEIVAWLTLDESEA